MKMFPNAPWHYYSYFLLGWYFGQFWDGSFLQSTWRSEESMNEQNEGLHTSVTATSVSSAFGKPSPVTIYIQK